MSKLSQIEKINQLIDLFNDLSEPGELNPLLTKEHTITFNPDIYHNYKVRLGKSFDTKGVNLDLDIKIYLNPDSLLKILNQGKESEGGYSHYHVTNFVKLLYKEIIPFLDGFTGQPTDYSALAGLFHENRGRISLETYSE